MGAAARVDVSRVSCGSIRVLSDSRIDGPARRTGGTHSPLIFRWLTFKPHRHDVHLDFSTDLCALGPGRRCLWPRSGPEL